MAPSVNFCVFVLFLGFIGYCNAFTLKVEPRTTECFTEEATKGAQLTLQFQVTAGGLLDIDCQIYNHADARIHSWNIANDGKHTWTAEADGHYRFCFGNEMAKWTPKWVSFFITSSAAPNVAKIEHIDPIERALVELSQSLTELSEEQQHLRTVERVHRETIESTNTRMVYWSVFEMVVVIAMGVFQIYYLKKFLEVRSTV